jgi:hypothetical protein
MSRSYTSSPPSPSTACCGTALLFNVTVYVADYYNTVIIQDLRGEIRVYINLFIFSFFQLISRDITSRDLSFCTFIFNSTYSVAQPL